MPRDGPSCRGSRAVSPVRTGLRPAARLGRAAVVCLALAAAPGGLAAQAVPDAREDLGRVTLLPLPRFVSIRAETANARRGPALDQRIDWVFMHRGLPVEVTAEYGQWRRVRDADGAGGWVHQSLLTGTRNVVVQGAAPVALRAGPQEDAAVRAMAEPGVIARLEGCEPGYCRITAGGLTGWVARGTIWGIGATEILAN